MTHLNQQIRCDEVEFVRSKSRTTPIQADNEADNEADNKIKPGFFSIFNLFPSSTPTPITSKPSSSAYIFSQPTTNEL